MAGRKSHSRALSIWVNGVRMGIWPVEGKGPSQGSWFRARLAMAVSGKNRRYAFRDIQRRHFNAMAPRCSYGRDAEPIIHPLIEETPGVIERVSAELPEGFPARVADRIFEGLRRTAASLDAMPARLVA